jgi:hypothetical protein
VPMRSILEKATHKQTFNLLHVHIALTLLDTRVKRIIPQNWRRDNLATNQILLYNRENISVFLRRLICDG